MGYFSEGARLPGWFSLKFTKEEERRRTYTEFHRGDTEGHRDLLRKLQAIQGDCFAMLAMTDPATSTQHPAP